VSRKGKVDASTRARIEADAATQAVTFRALSEEAGLSQAQVAELANMTQAEASSFEQREDHQIGRMRAMVEAMGGELKAIAVIKELRLG
jgi:transcriptional regulator with XRE-family HTH domain